jgi:hypothetical protein
MAQAHKWQGGRGTTGWSENHQGPQYIGRVLSPDSARDLLRKGANKVGCRYLEAPRLRRGPWRMNHGGVCNQNSRYRVHITTSDGTFSCWRIRSARHHTRIPPGRSIFCFPRSLLFAPKANSGVGRQDPLPLVFTCTLIRQVPYGCLGLSWPRHGSCGWRKPSIPRPSSDREVRAPRVDHFYRVLRLL